MSSILSIAALLAVLVPAVWSAEGVLTDPIARSSALITDLASHPLTLAQVAAVGEAADQLAKRSTGAAIPERQALRALLSALMHARIDPEERELASLVERETEVLANGAKPFCWSDLDAARDQGLAAAFYQDMASWVAGLRALKIAGYVAPEVVPPPSLPPSLVGRWYGGLPEPSIVKDPTEREAYAKAYAQYQREIYQGVLQRRIDGLIARAEAALAESLLANPLTGVSDPQFYAAVMLRSGASRERSEELGKKH